MNKKLTAELLSIAKELVGTDSLTVIKDVQLDIEKNYSNFRHSMNRLLEITSVLRETGFYMGAKELLTESDNINTKIEKMLGNIQRLAAGVSTSMDPEGIDLERTADEVMRLLRNTYGFGNHGHFESVDDTIFNFLGKTTGGVDVTGSCYFYSSPVDKSVSVDVTMSDEEKTKETRFHLIRPKTLDAKEFARDIANQWYKWMQEFDKLR
jgi:hypothetical protein